uniref:Sulfatase N-terminal domain-containing protein n=1 Tax=Plectus sambesii TaxID=2011161 RepID=A0A914W021_9BILA
MLSTRTLLASICLTALCSTARTRTPTAARPHIVLIVTDDQDIEAYGLQAMAKTNALLRDRGAFFNNAFVTTPICCVSRSSILTGKYAHNLRVYNNTRHGNCGGRRWRRRDERKTIASYLHGVGYSTFYAGKYLNTYGKKSEEAGVPPGWDWWNGLVGNSRYYNYSLVVNETVERHGDGVDDYLTTVIAQRAKRFIAEMSASGRPLFLMLCPPAPHAPYTSAVQYEHEFANASAPRTVAFDRAASDKHWLVAVKQKMSPHTTRVVDLAYRNRLRTLLSVDDLVEAVVAALDSAHILDNTFIVYTSDNGYHTGQFRLPLDKRQPYEFDVRVPLIVRGPGVPQAAVHDDVALNIDLLPTIAEWARVGAAAVDADGLSLASLLANGTAMGRNHFLIEYWGEAGRAIQGSCSQTADSGEAQCVPEVDCACFDARNNTYACVRQLNHRHDTVYCRFSDDVGFEESYNLRADPHQLVNRIDEMSATEKRKLRRELTKLRSRRGR